MQCFKINVDIVDIDSGVVCVHVVRQTRFIEGVTIHIAESSSVPRDGAKKNDTGVPHVQENATP